MFLEESLKYHSRAHPQWGATLGPQVIVNEVLLLQVALAQPARIVLAQVAAVFAATSTPTGYKINHQRSHGHVAQHGVMDMAGAALTGSHDAAPGGGS